MANVTVVTSNPSITVDQNTNLINVSTVASNVTVGPTVPGTLANTIATSGRFSTLQVGNVATVQYTFPIDAPTVDAGLKAYANGSLYWSTDVGLVDSVNGQTGDVVLDTDDITEGSNNLYYTAPRADDRVNLQTGANLDLSFKSTTDLTEGTNLYFTDTRVDSRLSSGSITSNIITTGGNISTTSHVITNNLTPVTGNTITVAGNMEVSGNLNVVEKVDLLLQDNEIVLNYGNASARDAFITVDRTGSGLGNAQIKWDNTNNKWEFGLSTGSFQTTLATKNGNVLITSTSGIPALEFNRGGSGTNSYLRMLGYAPGNGLETNEPTLVLNHSSTANVLGGFGIVQGGGNQAYLTHDGATDVWTTSTVAQGFGNGGKIPQEGFAASFTDLTASTKVITDLIEKDGDPQVKIKGDGIGGIQTNLVGSADAWRAGASANEEYWGQLKFAGFTPIKTNNNTTYAGTADIPNSYVMNGVATEGSATYTVTGIQRTGGFFGNSSLQYTSVASEITTALDDIEVGSVMHDQFEALGTVADTGFRKSGTTVPRVVSIDSANRTITFNINAYKSVDTSTNSAPNTANSVYVGPGYYSDTTGFAVAVGSAEDVAGVGKNVLGYQGILNKDAFGQTQYMQPTDFDATTNLDLNQFSSTVASTEQFLGTSKLTLEDPTGLTGTSPAPALNAPYSITVGKRTGAGNRPFGDNAKGFGINVGWDGIQDLSYYGNETTGGPVPQVSISNFTDNSVAGTNGYGRDQGGPRLLLSSFTGNADDPLTNQRPRKGDEMGRVQAWGRAQYQVNPSSVTANQKLSFFADDFTGSNKNGTFSLVTTDTETGIASRLGTDSGNGMSVSGSHNEPLTYVAGETVQLKGATSRYTSGLGTLKHAFATAKYSDTTSKTGSVFTVGHGNESRTSVIGDLKLGIKREIPDDDYTYTLDRGTYPNGLGGTVFLENMYPSGIFGLTGDALRTAGTNRFNTRPEDFVNGMQVRLDGFTGGFGTAVNGNTYYAKDAFAGLLTELYTDAALTTGLNTGVARFTDIDLDKTGTITLLGAGFSTNFTNDPQEYYWTLESGNDSLKLIDRRFGTDINVLEYDPVDRAVSTLGKFTFNRPIETANVITSTGGFSGNITGSSGTYTGTVEAGTFTDGTFTATGGNFSTVGNIDATGYYQTNGLIKTYGGDIETTTGNIITQGNINAGGGTLTGVVTSNSNVETTGFFVGDLDGAVVLDVYNDTGSTLNKGDAVYLTGDNNGDNPHVALADADDATKMPAMGLVREQIVSGVGQVVTSGVMNFSSHGFTSGADLYIDTTTPGALTETKPTGESAGIQKIGKVVSGNHVLVQGAFRQNEVSNLNEGNIFIGDATGAATTESFNTVLASNLASVTSLISTTANVQINPDVEIDGLKGLTYDVTNNFLGLGTTTPEAAFHQVSDNSGFSSTVLLTEYSTGTSAGDFRFQRGEGTLASPSVMNSGDRIGQIRFEPIFSRAAGNISYGADFNTTIEVSAFADGTQGGIRTYTNTAGEINQISQHSGNGIDRAIQDVQAHDNGTLTVDSITFADGQVYDDGTRVVISGVTESNVTPLQTFGTFFLKYVAGDGGRYELYDDDQLTTGSQRVTGSGFYSSGVGEVEVKPDQLYLTDQTISYGTGTIFTFLGATDPNVTPLNGQVAHVRRSGGSTSRRYQLFKDEARTIPWNLTGTLDLAGLEIQISKFYQPTGLQINTNLTGDYGNDTTAVYHKVRANGEIQLGSTGNDFRDIGTGNVIITPEGNVSTVGDIFVDNIRSKTSTNVHIDNHAPITAEGNITFNGNVVIDTASAGQQPVLSTASITAIIPNLNQGTQPSNFADIIVISGFNGSADDGKQVTPSGITDTGCTEVNGNTYYIKYNPNQGYNNEAYELYTDSGFLNPVQAMTSGSFIGSPSGSPIVSYDSGSTAAVYKDANITVKGHTTANTMTVTGTTSFTGATSIDDLTLKGFQETVVALGNQSGDISSSLNVDNGTIYSVTATGGITINSLANAVAGTSFVLIVTQDGSGNHTLTAGSDIKWAGGLNTLSTGAGDIDVISIFYDGTVYYASLGRGYV